MTRNRAFSGATGLLARAVLALLWLAPAAPAHEPTDCNANGLPDDVDLRPHFEWGGATFPLPIGSGGAALAAGDLDGDLDVDLLATDYGSRELVVLRCENGGFPGPAESIWIGWPSDFVTLADLDDDDDLDAVVCIYGYFGDGTAVFVYENDGQGHFSAPAWYPVGMGPKCVVAADFDHDGHLDLAAANRWSDQLAVLRGLPAGGFAPAVFYTLPSGPIHLVADDFDADGWVDLAVCAYHDDRVCILHNRGDGTFQLAQNLPAFDGPRWLVSADFDEDGDPDLAVVFRWSGEIGVYRNNGAGSFSFQSRVPIGFQPRSLAVADLDGDQHLDLVVALPESRTLSTRLGEGNGTFRNAESVSMPEDPMALALNDWDQDGDPDIAAVVYEPGGLIMAPNETTPPTSSDCNQNRIPDECDLATGASQDLNENLVPDECECFGDLDGDHAVGPQDLALLLAAWEQPGPTDLNASGSTDAQDLALLLAIWETLCD